MSTEHQLIFNTPNLIEVMLIVQKNWCCYQSVQKVWGKCITLCLWLCLFHIKLSCGVSAASWYQSYPSSQGKPLTSTKHIVCDADGSRFPTGVLIDDGQLDLLKVLRDGFWSRCPRLKEVPPTRHTTHESNRHQTAEQDRERENMSVNIVNIRNHNASVSFQIWNLLKFSIILQYTWRVQLTPSPPAWWAGRWDECDL